MFYIATLIYTSERIDLLYRTQYSRKQNDIILRIIYKKILSIKVAELP